MPIYPERPAPFICAICGDERPIKWGLRDQHDYPPVCFHCEQFTYGAGPPSRNPDTRLAKQIAVLAEELRATAYRAANPREWDHA